MVNVLLIFSQNHTEFRLPEFESVCDYFGIALDNEVRLNLNKKHLCVFNFKNVSEVCKILSRSVLLKGAYEVFAESTTHEDLISQMSRRLEVFEPFNRLNCSWALRFRSQKKKRDNNYRTDLMKKYTDFIELEKSPIDLKNPINEFYVIEENKCESVQREGQGSLKVQYNIKTRKYIGNSTMDPELSFIQANLTHCCPGSLMLDPFCGTGGLLLAASHFGALSLGVEINYQVARAVGKSSRTGEDQLSKDQSILANFQQYNLEDKFLGVLLADSSEKRIWHFPELASHQYGIFDAIVTDPPYGIREKGQKVGVKPTIYGKSDKSDVCRLPPKLKYDISNVYLDLLNLAVKLLNINGRLCFWFPVIRSEYSENVLPRHDCMERLYNCEQILTKKSSRRLLVYKKVKMDSESQAYFAVNCYESESYRCKVFHDG